MVDELNYKVIAQATMFLLARGVSDRDFVSVRDDAKDKSVRINRLMAGNWFRRMPAYMPEKLIDYLQEKYGVSPTKAQRMVSALAYWGGETYLNTIEYRPETITRKIRAPL